MSNSDKVQWMDIKLPFEKRYATYVKSTTKSDVPRRMYPQALERLATHLTMNVNELYAMTLDKLNTMQDRLLQGGDLYDFNLSDYKGAPSAAIGKLIQLKTDIFNEQFILKPALQCQEYLFNGNKTKQREIILQVIEGFTSHFSLKKCVQSVHGIDESVGEITIYRALRTLVQKRILHEIQLPNGEKRLELIKRHHDHIFCQNCGNIIEFYNDQMERLQEQIAQEHHGKLVSHTMTLEVSECINCYKENV